MAIAILPHGQPKLRFSRLADYALDDLLWPLCDQPPGETIADLEANDDLIVYSGSKAYFASRKDLKCRLSIVVLEPPAIQSRYYRLLKFIGKNYHRVLTHSSDLLSKLPNARFVPHGGTFLNESRVYMTQKEKLLSLVASKKNTTVGHRLRHRIASWSKQNWPDLDLYGYGYNAVEDKSLAHAPYWFSVVIENSRCPGYFTEKLIDSFLCRSLPIYWGAPDIAHFFDPRGMICCHDEIELRLAIARVSEADYWRRLSYLEANVQRALGFADFHFNVAKTIADELELNEVICPKIRAA